jgi:MoaA/NifB/PqqE/SkfB family radical SAM enzyme
VGRGEPTLNKRFPDMIIQARKKMPQIIMSMDTNATQEFKDEYLSLDWINCSIDGSTKEAYDTYRHGGDFFRAIRFMRRAVYRKAVHESKCKIIWKYILFNTTEDIGLMNTAQKMALSLGIDELHFVVTAVGSHDKTVTPAHSMNNFSTITEYIKANPIFPNVLVTLS